MTATQLMERAASATPRWRLDADSSVTATCRALDAIGGVIPEAEVAAYKRRRQRRAAAEWLGAGLLVWAMGMGLLGGLAGLASLTPQEPLRVFNFWAVGLVAIMWTVSTVQTAIRLWPRWTSSSLATASVWVPLAAHNKVWQLSERLGRRATFTVESIPKDPLLWVEVDGRRYCIHAWDEPGLEDGTG